MAPDSLPEDVTQSALGILGAAAQHPTRLSDLLAAARREADAVEDADLLQDVVWASTLWLFMEGSASTGDDPANHSNRGDLGSLLATLTVAVDETPLADQRYQGPDLTVAQPVMLDILDKEEATAR